MKIEIDQEVGKIEMNLNGFIQRYKETLDIEKAFKDNITSIETEQGEKELIRYVYLCFDWGGCLTLQKT